MTRFGNKDTRQFVRQAESEGWTASITNGGHVKLEHPDACSPVFCPATPSDHRSFENTRADMRRALRGEPTHVKELTVGQLTRDAYQELGVELEPPKPVLNEARRNLLDLGWCADCGDREEQAAALSDAEVRRFTREMRASMEQDAATDAPDAPRSPEPNAAAPRPSEPQDAAHGVWCVYNWDTGPYLIAPFSGDDEIGALRLAVQEGAKVVFVPYGASFADTVNL